MNGFKYFVALISLIFINIAQANIVILAKELLESNVDINKLKSQESLTVLGISSVRAQKSWGLTYNTTYDDNFLDSYPSTSSQQGKTLTHSLSLGRGFDWGGNFSIENGYAKRKAIISGTKETADPYYHFYQTLSYTQDLGKNFLGRDFLAQVDLAEENVDLTKVSNDKGIQGIMLGFYKGYISSKLNKSLVDLQKRAYERAVRRTRIIKKRVRDGLREKVDLLQSQMTEISTSEGIKSAEISLKTSLDALSSMLHRQVKQTEIENFDLAKIKSVAINDGDWESNKDNLLLKQQLHYLRKQMKRIDKSLLPQVELGASYKSNDYDLVKSSTAIKDGFIGSEHDEATIGITVTWPIGFKAENVEKSKVNVEIMTTEMEQKKLKASFIQNELNLKQRLALLEKNIEASRKRIDLARKVLKEYNRLYNLGRADIDQVIGSEEGLINTEKSHVYYLADRESLLVELASLYGDLKSYMGI